MTFLLGLLLTALFLMVTIYRMVHAMRTGNITGYLLNPLLYLMVLSFPYLVVGSMLSGPGHALAGFIFSPEAAFEATLVCYYFFLVILGFYFQTPDRDVVISVNQIGIIGTISTFILLISIPFSYAVLVQHGSALGALQGNRVSAMTYYGDVFLGQNYFGQLYCLGSLASILFVLKYPQSRKAVLLFFVSLFPFILTDYLQNGRGVMMSTFMIFYILFCIHRQKIYIAPVIAFVVFLSIFGIIYRTDYNNLDFTENLLNAFAEFYLTRATLDQIIDSNTLFTLQDMLDNGLSRLLPSVLRDAIGVESLSYTNYMQAQMDLSFGLAGNIVAESYFFGGFGFILVSPLIICAIYRKIYVSDAFTRLPLFLFNFYLISYTQNIVRTAFYENLFLIIGLFVTMFLFIIVFGRNIEVLKPRPN